ncbi:MAG: SRPBCC domain-containing protein, partial [Acetobacteraceae bacterium]|nr:SRPBCC domain-containing protein [Acetobacteraceae bacterium]
MTSLTLVRRIAARPSIVWDALTTPEGISCWWGPDAGPVLRAELDLRVGGHYRVRFRMLDGTEHETTGEYLEIEKPHRLLMSWRWLEGGGGPGDSRVEFRLRPIDEGTEFTLTHAQLPSDESARGHEWGWNGSLDKLRRHFSSPRGASARMSIPLLYAHPFSSYCQKAFIAFYEKDAPFELRLLSSQNPAAIEERHALWPLDRFPLLRADGQTIVESTIIIEWLD